MSPPRSFFKPGDHVCSLYATPQEHLAAAVEFLASGLQRRERCVYVCGEYTLDEFRALLGSSGIDVAAEEARGALILGLARDAFVKGGRFDPKGLIDRGELAVSRAIEDGFTGLCAGSDMNFVTEGAAGTDRILQYEALCSDYLHGSPASALCQYDRRRVPAAILEDCLATHPLVRVDGPRLLTNPFYGLRELTEPHPHTIERKLGRIREVNAVRRAD